MSETILASDESGDRYDLIPVDEDAALYRQPVVVTGTAAGDLAVVQSGRLFVSVAGSVEVTNPTANPETGLATEVTVAFAKDFRSADERPAELRYAQALTAGDSIVPAAGKALRIRKIGWLAQNNPNSVTLRWADTGSGVKNIWKSVATQQTVYETGAANRGLEVVLDNANPVDVNIHYEEITP